MRTLTKQEIEQLRVELMDATGDEEDDAKLNALCDMALECLEARTKAESNDRPTQ